MKKAIRRLLKVAIFSVFLWNIGLVHNRGRRYLRYRWQSLLRHRLAPISGEISTSLFLALFLPHGRWAMSRLYRKYNRDD